jgi:hypothetical protein
MAPKEDHAEDKIRVEEPLTSIPQELLMALLDNPYELMILIDKYLPPLPKAKDPPPFAKPQISPSNRTCHPLPGGRTLDCQVIRKKFNTAMSTNPAKVIRADVTKAAW